jgi:hypothetical protein
LIIRVHQKKYISYIARHVGLSGPLLSTAGDVSLLQEMTPEITLPNSENKKLRATPPVMAMQWGNPNDERNPRNWKIGLKIFHTLIPCLLAFWM